MSMQVLSTKEQVAEARRELVARNLSAMPSNTELKFKRFLARTRLVQPLLLGDVVKSWDVLETIRFCEQYVSQDQPILDIGAYASELVVALHRAGFTDLTGVDLDPRLKHMPDGDTIRYVTGDFMKTPFENEAFAAVTSISVIEHGYDPDRLFKEMSRILRPGGYFVASFDYWPEKINTTGTRFFDMDWLIFSRDDVGVLVDKAAAYGLFPVGEMRFEGDERAIEHGGFHYTFGWIALQRRS